MQVKVDKENIIISFERNFSDVTEYLGAKKGMIKTTVPNLYNDVYTNLLYEIAYYELDLEHTYSTYEIDILVKTGKIVLLSSRPYICVKEEEISKDEMRYAEDNLTTLLEYNNYNINRNNYESNKLVLDMLKKHSEELSQHYANREKMLLKK